MQNIGAVQESLTVPTVNYWFRFTFRFFCFNYCFFVLALFTFLVLSLGLAGKNVSNMTQFVLRGT